MYKVDALELADTKEDEEGGLVPAPPRLQLSAEHVAMNGKNIVLWLVDDTTNKEL